jgi:cobalt/nickel transport system permease protein
MHMSDALISTAVGGTLWAVSAAALANSSRRTTAEAREGVVPLMGVLGAFVFTAQMINFAIPGTGSSGHLGGGILLAVLLGPHAALLVMASVLAVQALMFADGGLLALGCNIFNLGVLPLFLAYPLVYRPLARRRGLAILLACLAGLLAGALAVVLETTLSGITALPFRPFLLAMLPIHLAIGLVEGLATAALVSFLAHSRPEILDYASLRPASRGSLRPLLALTLLCGGGLAWFASARPDGLEWAIQRLTGGGGLPAAATPVHQGLAAAQAHTALLPEYQVGASGGRGAASLAGLLGGGLVLGLVAGLGWLLRRRRD